MVGRRDGVHRRGRHAVTVDPSALQTAAGQQDQENNDE